MTARVVVWCGSTRTGSINEQLARMTTAELVDRGLDARFVDLRNYPMELFDPDVEAAEGPPPPAHELREILGEADAVVIVSPEYNGAMTPLLKNTVDWISRVDLATFFAKQVVVMAATPGRRAGASVRSITATWLSYIGADVHADTFGLPSARHVLVDGELIDGHDERLATFLDGVAEWIAVDQPAE